MDKNTTKEFKDPHTCKCGGRYKMAGYRPIYYYHKCDKCGKEVVISYIPEGKDVKEYLQGHNII